MFTFLLALLPVIADLPLGMPPMQGEPQEIVVSNRILAKVRDKTISVVDVVKQMDIYLNRYYPHLSNSKVARYQFYSSHWRDTLDHMIDNELMMADAESREIKVADGEVRETIQQRFGPNVMGTLEKLHLTYDEARKIIHEELIVQRMNWFRVTSKALQRVNMQDVKAAYAEYCKQNPAKELWKYQMLSIRGGDIADCRQIAEKACLFLAQTPDLALAAEKLKSELPAETPITLNLSSDYESENKDLAPSVREVLLSLTNGQFSPATEQTSRDGTTVLRVFHLKDHTKTDLPKFEQVAAELKDALLQKAANEEMAAYVSKLRSRFNFDAQTIEEQIPAGFEPFSLH